MRGLYRAATEAGSRLHEAMLRYHGALADPAADGDVRDRLEDYLARGQQYSTTLEMLRAALDASELTCARDEAERLERILWRHEALMRTLYGRLRGAGVTAGTPHCPAHN